MRLSYSKYESYLSCPRRYKLQMDRVEPPQKESKYFALYGILIQIFFQHYANTYLLKGVAIDKDNLRNVLHNYWSSVLEDEYVNWNDPWVRQTESEIFEEVYSDALKNMEVIDFWTQCRSEVSIEIRLKKSKDVLSSRIDFVRTLPDGSVEILDGKSTKHLDRPNSDQLMFYALLYFLRNKKLPKRLGWLFYRYQTVKYIDFDADKLIQFKNKLALAKKAMKVDTLFEPKVKLSTTCKWCPYQLTCEAFLTKKQANAEKRGKINADTSGDIVYL